MLCKKLAQTPISHLCDYFPGEPWLGISEKASFFEKKHEGFFFPKYKYEVAKWFPGLHWIQLLGLLSLAKCFVQHRLLWRRPETQDGQIFRGFLLQCNTSMQTSCTPLCTFPGYDGWPSPFPCIWYWTHWGGGRAPGSLRKLFTSPDSFKMIQGEKQEWLGDNDNPKKTVRCGCFKSITIKTLMSSSTKN